MSPFQVSNHGGHGEEKDQDKELAKKVNSEV